MTGFVRRWKYTLTAAALVLFANAFTVLIWHDWEILLITAILAARAAWVIRRARQEPR